MFIGYCGVVKNKLLISQTSGDYEKDYKKISLSSAIFYSSHFTKNYRYKIKL